MGYEIESRKFNLAMGSRTVKDLAQQARCGRTTIIKIRNASGSCVVAKAVADRICAALEVEPEALAPEE